MRSCWATERVDRPRFTAVVHLLDRLIRSPQLLRELAKPRSVNPTRVHVSCVMRDLRVVSSIYVFLV